MAGQRLHTWPLALSPVRTWCTICTVSFPKPCASQLPGTWIGPVCTAGPSAPPASLLGVGEWSENCQVPSSEKDCRAAGGAEAAAPRAPAQSASSVVIARQAALRWWVGRVEGSCAVG